MNSSDKDRKVMVEKTEQEEFRESITAVQPLLLVLTGIIFVFAIFIILQKLSHGGAAPDVNVAVLCTAGVFVAGGITWLLLKKKITTAWHHHISHRSAH